MSEGKCSFCKKIKEIHRYIRLSLRRDGSYRYYEVAVEERYLETKKANFVACKDCIRLFFKLFNADLNDD